MKYCTNCGTELPKRAQRFCPSCGALLEAGGAEPVDASEAFASYRTGAREAVFLPLCSPALRDRPRYRHLMAGMTAVLLVLGGIGAGVYFATRGDDVGSSVPDRWTASTAGALSTATQVTPGTTTLPAITTQEIQQLSAERLGCRPSDVGVYEHTQLGEWAAAWVGTQPIGNLEVFRWQGGQWVVARNGIPGRDDGQTVEGFNRSTTSPVDEVVEILRSAGLPADLSNWIATTQYVDE